MKSIKSDTTLTPDENNLYGKGNIKRLGKKDTEKFHTSVSIGMFVSNRKILDIHQTAAVF